MLLTGKTTIISYKSSNFKDKEGKEITFLQVAFHDKEGNKLTATVPEKSEKDVQLEKDSEDTQSVTGEATFEIVSMNNNGKNYPKLKLIKFVA